MGEIMHTENIYATDKAVYRNSAQRAINALAGAGSRYYAAEAGNPGDTEGAIGHVDRLLDRTGAPPWVAALHGAEANMRAAVADLLEAKAAGELMDFQIAASRALGHLDVAVGRPSEMGVFGGLQGALATTMLGVPVGATKANACGPVPSAPAFGTYAGYLGYIAVPATEGVHTLPGPAGGGEVSIEPGAIVLKTAAAPVVAKLCAEQAARQQVRAAHAASADPSSDGASDAAALKVAQSGQRAGQPAASGSSPQAPSAPGAAQAPQPRTDQQKASASQAPALYTEAQAAAGETIFAQHCSSCHGSNLQGTAAPSVAGKDFLNTAKQDGWSLEDIRFIVFTMMPRNSPGTLTPEQSAEVMAYLLASDCYPTGNKPFPAQDEPSFAKVKLGPVAGPHPGENQFGVCPLH